MQNCKFSSPFPILGGKFTSRKFKKKRSDVSRVLFCGPYLSLSHPVWYITSPWIYFFPCHLLSFSLKEKGFSKSSDNCPSLCHYKFKGLQSCLCWFKSDHFPLPYSPISLLLLLLLLIPLTYLPLLSFSTYHLSSCSLFTFTWSQTDILTRNMKVQ